MLTVSSQGFTTWEERNIFFSGMGVSIPNIVLQVGGTKSEVAVVAANDVVVPAEQKAFRNTPVGASGPSANVQNLQQRVAGVLPIAVEVPRTGASYKFVRPLVVDEETKVTFTYKTK
jgi:hypothetical protein